MRRDSFALVAVLACLISLPLKAQDRAFPVPTPSDANSPGLFLGEADASPTGLADLTCGTSGGFKFGFAERAGSSLFGGLCSIVFRCEAPKSEAVFIALKDGLCDPATTACDVRLWAPLEFPGNAQNFAGSGPTGKLLFYSSPTASSCAPWPAPTCGQITECGFAGSNQVLVDFISAWIERGGVTCANAETLTDDFSLAVWQCVTSNVGCRRLTPVNGLILGGPELVKGIGCKRDIPPDTCAKGSSCDRCRVGVGLGDGKPGFAVPGGGPGATLYHRAGGTGARFTPGEAAWRLELGRSWSHSYAERIVIDPDDSHVWLLTETGSFREWSDLSGGVYTSVSPSDEKRALTRTAGGWELRELDGMIHAFGSDGRWLSSTDRHGNAKTGTYSGGQLASVSFPDGRSETFTYHPDGKLATINEVGVGGSPIRTWSYVWVGDDLVRINRPDGTAWRFRYTANGYPGFVTHQYLVATNGTERVVQRWRYDREGYVVETWAGDEAVTGTSPNHWQFAYDDPDEPTVVTVTDPLGVVATVNLDREAVTGQIRAKTRITSYSGDCPSCSLGPNSQLQYSDSSNPLRPTRITDGKGHITDFAYDSFGMVTSKTEAVGALLERTTTYTYNATYPALIETVTRPSTSGSGSRISTTVYTGPNPTQRTESGTENGAPFSYSTLTTFNAAGMPLTIDPPGHGTADQVNFTYDATHGDLIPLTRTDPIGTTSYLYDGLNRRIGVIDPNGRLTETRYDGLNRVTQIIQWATATVPGGTAGAGDLRTRHFYNPFGDLGCTQFPRGNGISRVYDAAGRMTVVRQGITVAEPTLTLCFNIGAGGTLRQQRRFTLDGAGNRIREDLEQETAANVFSSIAATDYVYSTRCHLDKMIQAPGLPEEAVTEYAYDCNGNLERTWDPNHPSGGQVNPATAVYSYDALDHLTTLTQPWGGAGGGNVVTAYQYDVQDHLTAVTDGEGSVTSYVYSDRDLMTSEVSPVSGTTTHTFDEHGQLVSTTDARGVTIARTLDPADRVTLVDYPGADLDTTYTYGITPAAFDVGRLIAISRPNGTSVPYTYDRFGRALTDGELTFTYDVNGNRSTIGYPGGTVASYTYDYADRPTSLAATPAGGSAQTVASAAGYRPSGPLVALTLGNGAVETRTFDGRYVPTSIVASGNRLTWNYTTDNVGNPTAITQTQPAAESRTYAYQDHQYFLTSGNGPWPGPLSWTYDRIGNRLTETRGGLSPDVYSYAPNTATPTPGNTALLDQISLGTLGTRDYTFGPAGHLDEIVSGAVTTDYQHSPEGQLTDIGTLGARSTMSYDGRGFLRQAQKPAFSIFEDSFETVDTSCWSDAVPSVTESRSSTGGPGCFTPGTPVTTTATYGSEGLLYSLLRSTGERHHVLYFSGRPVAQLRIPTAGAATFTYLTTDHLGTPILAMNQAGTTLWRGGFEPFGADYNGAGVAGVFLRFPGQWDDATWAGVGPAGLSYNLHRWYERQTGRYERVDPLGHKLLLSDPYVYALSRPTMLMDPLGLAPCKCTDECPSGEWLYEGVAGSGAVVLGRSSGTGNYECSSNRRVRVPVKVVCDFVGPIFGIGIGVEGAVPGFPSACGCNSGDILGESDAIVGSVLFITASVSGCGNSAFSIGKRTLVLGAAKSLGAGLGYAVCETTARDFAVHPKSQ